MMDKIRISPFFLKEEINKRIKKFLTEKYSYLIISENETFSPEKKYRFVEKDCLYLLILLKVIK